MKQVRICPECGTEYFPHIQNCADCGAALLLPEEARKLQEEKKRCADRMLQDAVAVREGALNWMDELRSVLIDSGISCSLHTDPSCGSGCCGGTYKLIVERGDAVRADERIEEYCRKVHPELQTSKEMADQGKCPACGHKVNPDAAECPDCGLTLFISE